MKGVVVTTSQFTLPWLKDCLASIPKHIEVLVVVNGGYEGRLTQLPNVVILNNDWNGFELGGIERGMTYFDQFIYIPDTFVFKQPWVIAEILKHKGGMEISHNFLSYIGKYDSKVLAEIGVPRINTKKEAVDHEFLWTQKYMETDKNLTKYKELLPQDTFLFKEKHGRNNMVNECSWGAKFKGTWDTNQIK